MDEREAHLADPLFASIEVDRMVAKEYAAAARGLHESPTTTQVSVVDGSGNAVSLTHTLGASGGVVTPGLGFNYNNYLNCFDPRPGRVNSLAPGNTTCPSSFHQRPITSTAKRGVSADWPKDTVPRLFVRS